MNFNGKIYSGYSGNSWKEIEYGEPYHNTSILGIYVDMDNGTLEF